MVQGEQPQEKLTEPSSKKVGFAIINISRLLQLVLEELLFLPPPRAVFGSP